MPARPPEIATAAAEALARLGQQIRAQRKAMRVNATVTAEAAGISRVTLHRIEKGEPAVTMGAYLNVMAALNLVLGVADVNAEAEAATDSDDAMRGWLPARIRLSDYPQLKQLAWQVQGTDTLTPTEALSIYERNARHLDMSAMTLREQNLIEALRLALGDGGKSV